MTFVDTLLKRLETEQGELAREALSRPQGRDDFEYGRMCGLYAGLDRARTILVEMIRDQDDKDDTL